MSKFLIVQLGFFHWWLCVNTSSSPEQTETCSTASLWFCSSAQNVYYYYLKLRRKKERKKEILKLSITEKQKPVKTTGFKLKLSWWSSLQ